MFQQAREDVVLDISAIDEATGGYYSTTVAHYKRKLELLKEQGVEIGDIDKSIRKAVEPHYQVLLTYGIEPKVAEKAIQDLIEKESKLFEEAEE